MSECKHCGTDLNFQCDPYFYRRHGIYICGSCADIVINVYWHLRSGEYLTWQTKVRDTKPEKKPIPQDLRWLVFERDDFTCLCCGVRSHLCADHVTPESKGGETTVDNLQTLCRSCNSKKGVSEVDYRAMQ